MRILVATLLSLCAVYCDAAATSATLPRAAVGITFDSNNIYNWSIWQFDTANTPPTHAHLADIPGFVT